ncbi:MAG: hypothetical protein AAF192_20770 [Pseudomonadota bacterium]
MPNHRARLIAALAALALAPGAAQALTLAGDNVSIDVDATPVSATLVSGAFSTSLEPIESAIDLDIRTGAFNFTAGSVVDFVFAEPVINNDGSDLTLIDGRFDVGAIDLSIDGGTTYFAVDEAGFNSAGVTEVISRGDPFTPFVVDIDLSDLGLAPGDGFTTLRLRTTNEGLDLMAVAARQGEGDPRPNRGDAAVPLPGALPLLASALLGGLLWQRRART